MSVMSFEEFSINERKKRPESKHPYFKGLSKSTIEAKKRQMKKQASMSDSDPSAYKPLPGDAKHASKIKKSKHTSKYEEMYRD